MFLWEISIPQWARYSEKNIRGKICAKLESNQKLMNMLKNWSSTSLHMGKSFFEIYLNEIWYQKMNQKVCNPEKFDFYQLSYDMIQTLQMSFWHLTLNLLKLSWCLISCPLFSTTNTLKWLKCDISYQNNLEYILKHKILRSSYETWHLILLIPVA